MLCLDIYLLYDYVEGLESFGQYLVETRNILESLKDVCLNDFCMGRNIKTVYIATKQKGEALERAS